MTPMRWYHSVAVKSSLAAFVATHIPLLGLIALILFWPGLLSPWGVFVVALVLTLLATTFVVATLWRMFHPLRRAADGLRDFMSSGAMFRGPATGSDEVGRMVEVLVRSLAHIDRSRGALLHSSSLTLEQVAAERGVQADSDIHRWLVLIELDRPATLDGTEDIASMLKVHEAMDTAVSRLLHAGEISLPWGRGRFLAMLNGSNADTVERLDVFCRNIPIDEANGYSATVAVEPEHQDPHSRAASLQRLEHKLFAMRSQGMQATVS